MGGFPGWGGGGRSLRQSSVSAPGTVCRVVAARYTDGSLVAGGLAATLLPYHYHYHAGMCAAVSGKAARPGLQRQTSCRNDIPAGASALDCVVLPTTHVHTGLPPLKSCPAGLLRVFASPLCAHKRTHKAMPPCQALDPPPPPGPGWPVHGLYIPTRLSVRAWGLVGKK